MPEVKKILQFECELTVWLEKINRLCRQQWFPYLGKKETDLLKRAKDEKELSKKIEQ